MPATYDGFFLFGDSVKMVTAENPRRCQMNSYPGLDGVEELDQGFNGRVTMVRGRLAADSPFELGVKMNVFRSYSDGRARVLVDTEGIVWPFAKLESFQPEGEARYCPPYGYTRSYVARFRHVL